MIIFSPDHFLPQQKDVLCGFFGRQGGVSAGIYDSLNCGLASGDSVDLVRENRRRIAQHMGANSSAITLYQHHSADCLVADMSFAQHIAQGQTPPKGDALVTDQPGILLGVLTADCGPVLFQGRKSSGQAVVGAAHAGWGGALKGVLEQTVSQMRALGATPESLKAAVGPCIAQKSYEVSAGFEKPFLDQDEQAELFFKSGTRAGHLMFDLPGYIAFRLAGAGVPSVILSGMDTYRAEAACFSFRRATHRGEPSYGRQMSAIMIRP